VADAVWISRHGQLETFIATQTEYNLLNRSAEKDVIPALAHYGLGFIPYYPLASGLLTGKYSAGAAAQGRLKDNFLRLGDAYLTERNLGLVSALEAFCRAREHSLLELAVSWLAQQSIVASVIDYTARLIAGSVVAIRHVHHEPVQLFGHLDLTGQTTVRLHVVGHLEHGLFQVVSCAGPAPPGLVDIDMAGRTGAGTSANSGNPRHAVRHGTLHNTVARLQVHYMLFAARFDVRNL
jgi:Aldo/keto reductase family